MTILMLAEGDPETWSCWSGSARGILEQLRAQGHTVETANVDLRGHDRWLAAGATLSPNRRRWATRYHLAAVPFELRSRRADAAVARRRGRVDAILQIGATFRVRRHGRVPRYLCCDSNIRVAEEGQSSGFSDASVLRPQELRAIARRELAVYRDADGIFTLSERLRRSFVTDFGIPEDKVRAIHAGPNLDLARIPGLKAARPEAQPPTILFVGFQFHRKGGDLLVESFRRIRNELPSARLVLAGPPADFAAEPGVVCLGSLDKQSPEGWQKLLQAYQSADVFVLPTRFEPFGIAFVEAMHFALPCIGPDAWAVPEIIADGETGFTVPPENVDALTERLLYLLRNPALARRMGEAAQQRARGLFTWQHAAARLTGTIASHRERPVTH
jgi:glycosyltransferase involved in cell wall biosynthesis